VIWGVACYLMWGFFPAFFPLLEPADPMEILAHRLLSGSSNTHGSVTDHEQQ